MKCNKCTRDNTAESRFCGGCGQLLLQQVFPEAEKSFTKLLIYFGILLTYIAIVHFVDWEYGYMGEIVRDSILALIVIVFFIIDIRRTARLFVVKSVPLLPLLVVLFMPVFAWLINNFAGWLNNTVFHTDTNCYASYLDAPSPLLFAIISVGIFPAIFEELAFRAILFDELDAVAGKRSAILISAFLFTLLHLSIVSFIWILPIGLLFGYLRTKYNHIVFGIAAHFVYNSTIVILDMLQVV